MTATRHLLFALHSLAILCVALPSLELLAAEDYLAIDVVDRRVSVFESGSNASSSVLPAHREDNAASLVELIDRIPAVSKQGQNGLYQVLSIRGLSGQRVKTFYAGVPLATERRAGTAASFIDPWFMGEVNVIRGPSSLSLGSGAIGGAFLVEPRFFSEAEIALGFEAETRAQNQSLGWGNRHWSLGLGRRSSDMGSDALGKPLNTRYLQQSATLQHRTSLADVTVSSLLLLSQGRGIGRSNVRYPEQQIATVPREDNALANIQLSREGRWTLELYGRDYETESDSRLPGESRSLSLSSSLDWGGSLQSQWRLGQARVETKISVDARDDVEASEARFDQGDGGPELQKTLDGELRNYKLAAIVYRDYGDHSFQLGVSHDWLGLDDVRHVSRRHKAFSGAFGWQWYFSERWSLSVNVANAFRVPSLTELFFSGTTARGTSLGNDLLRAEESRATDLGVHWLTSRKGFSIHLFRQEVEDYIDRVRIDGFTRTFNNLPELGILGAELEGFLAIGEAHRIDYNLYWMAAEDDAGRPVAGVPGVVGNLAYAYQLQDWRWSLQWQHRVARRVVAATELPLDSADSLKLSLSRELGDSFSASIYLQNALNQAFRLTADELSTLANRRSVGLRLFFRW